MTISSDIARLGQWLKQAEKGVFFGGAGVSADSGIPDFRSSSGLYREKGREYYLSRACLAQEPEEFYRFFRQNMLFPNAAPNAVHKALARWEQEGRLQAVVTQNIDGLHQAAGSKRVIELHGTASKYDCTVCRASFGPEILETPELVPRCPHCGGTVRPRVTLYGEPLDGFSFEDARQVIASADLLIVGGSSLTVHPAASLLTEFRGERFVIVNRSPTPFDGAADLVIREGLGAVFSQID